MVILIVEDDKKIASFVRKGLENEQFTTELAFDGEEAIEKISINDYDLIILDIMLPKMNGFQVAQKIRDMSLNVPILMLTARDALRDKVEGLDSGADDYLVKPFSLEELFARSRALLRRPEKVERPILKVDTLEFNPSSHEIFRNNREIELGHKEYRILDFLLRHENQVCTRTMINEHVWGYNSPVSSNVIDVYISKLRDKVDGPGDKNILHTVRGVGYIIKNK